MGEPSESNRSSYFLPCASVALQETLDTCCLAKLPTCLHAPVEGSTDGTGNPSALGPSLDLNRIRSIGSSYKSSCSLRGTVKPDRPPGLWENATVLHVKSRSAILSVLHLPVIDANRSLSIC